MKSNAMRRVVWMLVLLVCAGGAGLSFELSRHHIQGGFGPDSLFARMCEEGTASCDEVVKSWWGTFYGIPTAVGGLMYFTGVGLWYLLAGLPNRAGRGWQLLPIAGTLAGLAVAAWLDYVMFARLPSWCPLCFGTHVASLLIFAGSVLMWPRKPTAVREAPAGEPPATGDDTAEGGASPGAGRAMVACAAILIAAFAVHQNFMNRHHRAEEKKAKEMLKEWASSSPGRGPIPAALAVRPDDAVWGDAKAPDTVVVFSDFECPVCGGFAAFWRKEVEPYAVGRVRLVFHYFPMNTGCNPVVNTTLHERSCEAAAIAEAARLQGGNEAFWKMHDELFRNQLRGRKRLSPEELANRVGLDPVRLEKDRTSPPVREHIARDIERARQVGVKGTPAVFLNGRLVQTSAGDPVWQSFLESLHTALPATAPAGGAEDCAEVRAALADCQARLQTHAGEAGTSVTEIERAAPRTLALRSDDPSKGNPKARAVVVVFSDFESPRCREFAEYWRRRVEPHVLNRTRLVFRHFPMNTDCNPVIGRTVYADSCRSAAAAEAARLQGGNEAFWKMYDELFENQARRPTLSYAELAKRIGLDAARLERDMNSAAVRERIQQDISFAQQAEVSEVPAVFLNGRIIRAWARDELWQYFLRFAPEPKPATASAPAR